MTTLTFRHGVLAGLGTAALLWATSTGAQSQTEETRRRAEEALAKALGGKVYTGAEMGFKARGFDRETPVVVPVVKLNGEWVEVQIGVPGIRMLSK